MKTTLSIFFALLFIHFIAGAYNVESNSAVLSGNTVSGRIIDQASGQALEYVSVALYDNTDSSLVTGTISDASGAFALTQIAPGTYHLKITSIGYAAYHSAAITLSKAEKNENLGDIALSTTSSDIAEVFVSAEKSRIEYKIDKRVVNVDKELSAKGGTAVQALENTPSVQVDGQGNLTLRGSSDYIVLIDGKPSILKGSDALKQIPANNIKQIEVITNPSAKYDADGQAGIINVIMKKELMQGLNGNLSAAYGNTDKASANATLNFRKKNVNLFAGFDYADNTYRETIDVQSKITLPAFSQTTTGTIRPYSKNENLCFRGGLDWEINPKNNLSLSGGFSKQGYDNASNATSEVWNSTTNQTNTYKSDILMDVKGNVFNVSLDYSHQFSEKQKLSFSNHLSTWKGQDVNTVNEYFSVTSIGADSISVMNDFVKDNHNFTYRMNVDFVTPLLSGELEAGAQYRVEPRYEDLLFRDFRTESKTWEKNDEFSYVLDYDNTIYSGYCTYSGQFRGIGYKIGLRSEYFMRSIDLSTEEASIDYNKFMFYPSVHLSKDLNEKNQIQASYSRRINRPQPWVLNNTPKYLDTRNVMKGSPYLIPEFTDAFELNYRSSHEKVTFWLNTYFRNTSNALSALRIMGDDGTMYHTLSNSKNQQAYGAETGADFKLFKWWNLNTNVNVYNYKLTTTITNVDKLQEVITWDARMVNNFNLKWGTRLQATAYYRAPGVDPMGKVSGITYAGLAANQSLLKGKLNLNISAQNLLKMKYTYDTKTEQFDNQYIIQEEGPIFMASITYNFNNFQHKNRGRSDDLQFKGGGGF
ncbi:MAG: TonB-dependent receptor [Prolixibacteraceae bacterium]|nr:TonB-dependent receptor [Prolixibacteraceae bacterium]